MNSRKGAVSVFLCAVFVSVVIVVGAAGDACSLAVANSYAERINYLSCKSVLAEYNRNLFEDYGFMAFNGGNEEICERIREYSEMMQRVGSTPGDEIIFFDVLLDEVKVDCGGRNLAEPSVFLDQLGEIMKYKTAENVLDMLQSAINSPVNIEDKVKTAESNRQQEAADKAALPAPSDGADSGSEASAPAGREKVDVNNNTFNAEEGFSDRTLRSSRIKDSLASRSGESSSGRNRFVIGKEDELMELGKDSSEAVKKFYASAGGGAEKLLLIGYIRNYFRNAVEDTDSGKETFFKNEQEYIIKGSFSDKSNGSAVKRELFLLRTGLNLAHIYSDTTKYNITLEAAAGAGPYAPVVQFVLASAWAAAEANEDMNILYSGGKVAFIKSKQDWKLGFDSIYGSKVSNSEYGGERGLDYSAYVTLLLFTVGKDKLTARTMDLIQINMKGRYDIQFDLRNHIVGFTETADFRRDGRLPSVLPGVIEDEFMIQEGTFEY